MNVLRHGMSRRKFLKSTATASAALALSPLAAPVVRAASALKLGYVSPAVGPARALRRGGQVHHRELPRQRKGRSEDRQTDVCGRGARKGQPVQSEPRGGSREGTDCQGQGRRDGCRLDARDDQPGGDAVRDRGNALHFDGGAVAALFHRPPGQSRRSAPGSRSRTPFTFFGASRTSSRSTRTCGDSCRPTNRSEVSFPTTATATPGATSRRLSVRAFQARL